MRQFAKPTIVVSKCLEFDACRYNGEMIPDVTIRNLQPFVTFIPVCPEVEIGLGTPRETIRIVEEKGLINLCNRLQEKTSLEKWSNFQINFTNDIRCGWFYFKNRSPSCGTRDVKIYSGFEKHQQKERDLVYLAEQ